MGPGRLNSNTLRHGRWPARAPPEPRLPLWEDDETRIRNHNTPVQGPTTIQHSQPKLDMTGEPGDHPAWLERSIERRLNFVCDYPVARPRFPFPAGQVPGLGTVRYVCTGTDTVCT